MERSVTQGRFFPALGCDQAEYECNIIFRCCKRDFNFFQLFFSKKKISLTVFIVI